MFSSAPPPSPLRRRSTRMVPVVSTAIRSLRFSSPAGVTTTTTTSRTMTAPKKGDETATTTLTETPRRGRKKGRIAAGGKRTVSSAEGFGLGGAPAAEPSTAAAASDIARTKRRKIKIEAGDDGARSVKRTRSFEPVWWGNVFGDGDARRENKNCPPVHTLILGTHPSVQSLSRRQYYGHPLNAFWYIAGDCLGFRRSSATSPSTGKPYTYYEGHLRFGHGDILEYSDQMARLVERGFALWDIVDECERPGSLDMDIKEEVPNPIREFCEGSLSPPSLSATRGGGGCGGARSSERSAMSVKRIVITNGTTGSKFFVKHFGDWFLDGKIHLAGDKMSQSVFGPISRRAAAAKKKKGGKYYGKKEDGSSGIEVICLPSVSPAAANLKYLEKRDAWERGCYEPGLADYGRWKQSQLGPRDTQDQPQLTTEDMPSALADASTEKPQSSSRAQTSAKRASVKNSAVNIADCAKEVVAKVKRRSSSPSSTPARRSKDAGSGPYFASSDLSSVAPENVWIDLHILPAELRPSATLTTGQCFNWIAVETSNDDRDDHGSAASGADDGSGGRQRPSAWGTHDAREWIGPIGDRVVSIRETPSTTLCRVIYGPADAAGVEEDLRHYFRLETPLVPLYEEWSRADVRLAKIAHCIPGVRILRQDPVECMFSFICSSNNNIPRITKMLAAFREKYGAFMIDLPTRVSPGDGGAYESGTMALFSFPTLEALRNATEKEMRAMGLGYRAKYIVETIDLLLESGGERFLLDLRACGDSQIVQNELIKFCGIGRKVADCIALFSLDGDNAIPVDVHVQHIASRDYDPTLFDGAKSLTPAIYNRVGEIFRERFPSRAGWAHSLLFVAELPSFRGVLPPDVLAEMDEWRERELEKKASAREAKKKAKKITD